MIANWDKLAFLVPCGAASKFAAERLGFQPDPMQEQVLNSDSRRGIVCCHRQWGKSTTIAIKAVHTAWCQPGSLVLVVAPSLRQSAETVRKAEQFVRKLGARPRGDGDNQVSILLPNQSRIVGLPESEHTIVGFSNVALLVIDEAARVPDTTYHALRPMLLNSDGALWMLSTPLGQRGFFHQTWLASRSLGEGWLASRSLGEGWLAIHVPASANPRIRPGWIDEERATLPKARFAQDYECEFLQPDNAVFREEDVQALFRSDLEPLTFLR
jgi:hypothetical protein